MYALRCPLGGYANLPNNIAKSEDEAMAKWQRGRADIATRYKQDWLLCPAFNEILDDGRIAELYAEQIRAKLHADEAYPPRRRQSSHSLHIPADYDLCPCPVSPQRFSPPTRTIAHQRPDRRWHAGASCKRRPVDA